MLVQIQETADFLRSKGITTPHSGIILGTGLGQLVHAIETTVEIPYAEIPNFPVSTVESHKGKLVYGVIYANGSPGNLKKSSAYRNAIGVSILH